MALKTRRFLLVSVEQVPSIGSVDPVSSLAPHLPTQPTRAHAPLRKAKSFAHRNRSNDIAGDAKFGSQREESRSSSPVLATYKRQRSAASTTQIEVPDSQESSSWRPNRHRSKSATRASNGSRNSAVSTSGSVYGSDDRGSCEYDQDPVELTRHAQSRGRTRHRTPTPFAVVPETQLSSSLNLSTRSPSRDNVAHHQDSRSRNRLTLVQEHDEQVTNILALRGNSSNNGQAQQKRRPTNGAFLLRQESESESDEFRFPVPRSQPEPVWHPGDGFSSDEATPDFVFYVTGQRKRRRPRSLPGLGRLSLGSVGEKGGSIRDAKKRQRTGQPFVSRKAKLLRGAAKDTWPTYDDFMSSTLPLRPRQPPAQESSGILQPSAEDGSPQARNAHKPRTALKHVAKRRKEPLEFQNLGSSVEPEVPSTYTPAMLCMRAFRLSSPLQDIEGEPSVPPNATSFVAFDIEEMEESIRSFDDDVDSDQRDATVHSRWDENETHLCPNDLRDLEEYRRQSSNEPRKELEVSQDANHEQNE
ncbi:hypothetical protein SCAR479_12090 [Seiridium cardinale]|uniref:Uncharacterized protein n=1 Tax=Seiridium cardinale TaxID=138064 RepID=A0ABR2XBM7_9PEZI